MPIHDLGYRNWQGKLTPIATRWMVISRAGIRRVWQNMWLRRMLFVSALPAFVIAIGFFAFEQSIQLKHARDDLGQAIGQSGIQGGREIGEMLMKDPAAARHDVWSFLLMTFFRMPQTVVMAVVIGFIAPGLIAQDVRSRAFLLYFSRPITPAEYLLGKIAILWAYLSLITTVPALVLYACAVAFSPDLNVVVHTWDLPFRVLVASVVVMLPTTTLALCMSSLTSESRFAGFMWFAVWVCGWVAYGTLQAIQAARAMSTAQSMGSRMTAEQMNELLQQDPWAPVSLFHALGKAQGWVFGLESTEDVWLSALMLIVVTVAALSVLRWRVSAPLRV